MKSFTCCLAVVVSLFFSKNLAAKTFENVGSDSVPRIFCKNIPSVNLDWPCFLTIWAADFLDHVEDDNFSPDDLTISIRKRCTGYNFPLDAQGNPIPGVSFISRDGGFQTIELWVKNPAGKTSFCEASIFISNTSNSCDNFGNSISQGICLKTVTGQRIKNATIEISNGNPVLPPLFPAASIDTFGCLIPPGVLPMNASSIFTPVKDDHLLNGVTTYDLLTLSRHILGVKPMTSPYQQIAADVNRSGSITTNDIVELRKLVLGIYTELPNNTSWRFVHNGYIFPNLNNPFSAVFPESKMLYDLQSACSGFIGMKIGDLNNSATPAFSNEADDREPLSFFIENQKLAAGETAIVPIFLNEKTRLDGFQFEFQTDPNQVFLENILPGSANISAENFYKNAGDGTFSISWTSEKPLEIEARQPVFYLKIRNANSLGGSQNCPFSNSENSGFSKPAADLSKSIWLKTERIRPEIYDFESIRSADLNFLEKISGSGAATEINFYPNPATDFVWIDVKTETEKDLIFEIFDLAGRSVLRGENALAAGQNQVAMPVKNLSAGLFFCKILVGGEASGRVFLKK